MTALHQHVRRTIMRHRLSPPGARLLIGLSGGADSVALTLLLLELAPSAGFEVAGLAHFNHCLRPTADRDERFCRDLAARLGRPIAIDAVDVQRYAASERLSIEEAARRARYAFLHRAAADAGADLIAVGHTRDDQAETFLLKLVRGAGMTGLGGIYPRRGAVIRPLLDVSRADLREFLRQRAQDWVEDETNASLDNARARVRHRVIPELDFAYGGATTASIARAADLVREDGQWLDDLGDRRFEELAGGVPQGLEFDAATLAAEAPPIRRRVLLRAMRSLSGGREVGLEHVQAALEVLGGVCDGADVPGSRVELRRRKLVLVAVRQELLPK